MEWPTGCQWLALGRLIITIGENQSDALPKADQAPHRSENRGDAMTSAGPSQQIRAHRSVLARFMPVSEILCRDPRHASHEMSGLRPQTGFACGIIAASRTASFVEIGRPPQPN